MNGTAIWSNYEFNVYHHGGEWNNVGGIYIFAGLNQQYWTPYYIGQCGSFLDRIPSHEQWDMAQFLGASHVHAMVVPLEVDRLVIERELIRFFQPALNVQFL